jgi:tRNA 2-(methylsulfanyl)-N6-isopentenyladenosine37 hydroxylase
MLHLSSETVPGWAERAAIDLTSILLDHAHLEKKAASTAIQLIFKYPERSRLVLELSKLAREELEHFELVLGELEKRKIPFQRLHPAPYAGRLHEVLRPNDPERLLDQLLVCAVIEARSCERMRLLAEHLESKGHDLAPLYRSLLASEARHHRLYLDLAEEIFPREHVASRLAEVTAHEARILSDAPHEPRLHSG